MHPLSLRPSIPVDTGSLHRVSALLSTIEDLRDAPTGVLQFYPQGQVYLESGRVCWAVYPGQHHRLVQLLRHQRSPPIAAQDLEDILKNCRRNSSPFARAMLDSGEITEDGLRSALLSHSSECIARVANSDWRLDGFTPAGESGYRAQFHFSTLELIAHLGAGKHMSLARAARNELLRTLSAGGWGLAFLRRPNINHPVMIAVHGTSIASVDQAIEVCAWTSSMFDLARAVDGKVYVASGSWRGSQAVVTWRSNEINYAALFSTRAASALALVQITRGSGLSPREE